MWHHTWFSLAQNISRAHEAGDEWTGMAMQHVGFDEPWFVRLDFTYITLEINIFILCAGHEVPDTGLNMMFDTVLPRGHTATEISKGARCKMSMRYIEKFWVIKLRRGREERYSQSICARIPWKKAAISSAESSKRCSSHSSRPSHSMDNWSRVGRINSSFQERYGCFSVKWVPKRAQKFL